MSVGLLVPGKNAFDLFYSLLKESPVTVCVAYAVPAVCDECQNAKTLYSQGKLNPLLLSHLAL